MNTPKAHEQLHSQLQQSYDFDEPLESESDEAPVEIAEKSREAVKQKSVSSVLKGIKTIAKKETTVQGGLKQEMLLLMDALNELKREKTKLPKEIEEDLPEH